jgi:ribosomal protein S18 acetylase RimI-like enzyme
MNGLRQQIIDLVLREQAAHTLDIFVDVNINSYIEKIVNKAEISCLFDRGSISGFIAFYCNDFDAKTAFISLVLVSSRARSQGLGCLLVRQVLCIAKKRGFHTCDLEVLPSNKIAINIYRGLGFSVTGEVGGKWQMRCDLTQY